MKRRHFLQYTGAAAAWSGFKYNGFALNPISHSPMFKSLAGFNNENNRVLVLIQLTGGNDGLNTMIPMDQYDKLATVRQNILIPENKVLSMDGTTLNTFHPSFSQVRNLYNEGKVSIIQNVGYPNQDYSHFRSTDIWMSGSDSNEYLDTGWAGRYLQNLHPDFPDGYPNLDYPDPLAVQIGSVASLALMGNSLPMGIAISDPQSYYQFVNDQTEPTPNTPYGQELSFIRLVAQQAQTYYESIKAAADIGKNLSTLYPVLGENNLADQLRIVAQLISGGLRTPIYVVALEGFDTHSKQVNEIEGTIYGVHANLLSKVSAAIGAFQDDLQLLDIDDRVAGMTFSEFGRTIASNGSIGTDHGAGAPMFVFGKKVIPGIIGNNPIIPDEVGPSEDIPMEHDFRSVYATALKDWFGLPDPETALGDAYPILPIFKAPSVGIEQPVRSKVSINNYPNPFVQETTFTFTSNGGDVLIQITDINGKVRDTILEGKYPAGTHTVTYRRKDLPSGTYFYSIRVNGAFSSKKLLVI
jgi:uncharacterized protein (DUF1501 family)